MNDVMGTREDRYIMTEKTGISSGGFHNSLQKMEPIDG